uniref:RRM domain-containing protein n=1 Tax=Anopheles epiroticus TaxID=199890 RepID=A0A182PSA6_9DIPT
MAQEQNSPVPDLNSPPFSRLFVLCGKQVAASALEEFFAPYGTVEQCHIVQDQSTGQSKGIGFVKFQKTSQAARALKEADGKHIEPEPKPIKVEIASSTIESKPLDCLRLKVKCPVEMDADAVKAEFGKISAVNSVQLVPDKKSPGNNVAYLTFESFLDAALAFETAKPEHKAKFAKIKPRKVSLESVQPQAEARGFFRPVTRRRSSALLPPTKLTVLCSSTLTQNQIWRLFDIIPGLMNCSISHDGGSISSATVTYNSAQSAKYAREKLHKFEYPIGERIVVRDASDISQASFKVSVTTMSDSNRPSKEISEEPPMSRLFIICGKQITREQLTKHFESDGTIEECVVITDRRTGQGKGVAYVKFNKTSAAARGLRKNGTVVEGDTRPIKVMISANYNRDKQSETTTDVNENHFLRLFAIVPSNRTEEQLKEEFGTHGTVTQVRLVPDKKNERQCAAYIKFTSFLETALAIENCNPQYKAKFCVPRNKLQQEQKGSSPSDLVCRKRSHTPDRLSSVRGDTKLVVICSSQLNQDRLWRLFDICPGMKYCSIITANEINLTAAVVYSAREEAQRAVDKIHGLEYPIGERIIVRFEEEFKEDIITKDTLSQFGPTKPLVSEVVQCVKKAFFICMPEAVSVKLLTDAFCRFGDLIKVYLVPGKRHGYAEFASDIAANRAIQQLHGMQLGNCRLKVLECAENVGDPKRTRLEH